jgi:DNA-binding IclR family transcriptional regulator
VSKTLLRGLSLIEVVGLHGPLTVTELARRMGMHVTIASRTITACEQDGWLTRIDGKINVGPRSALLGLSSPVSRTIRQVEPIVRAIAGICDVATTVTGLIGTDVMVLASAGTGIIEFGAAFASRAPVHVMASGRAIAAQLSEAELDAVLPSEPFASAEQVIESLGGAAPMKRFLEGHETTEPPSDVLPRTRQALCIRLEAIRAEGFARDHGELHPNVNCIAVPWPSLALPASLTCFGSRDLIEQQRALIEVCLRTATQHGATAQDVIRAAAAGG